MKRPILRYVKFVPTRDGRGWHAYFDTGKKLDGKRVYTALGLWGSPGFFDRYATLQGHRTRNATLAGVMTVNALIEAYSRSQTWAKLSEGSRRAYGYAFARIREFLGNAPVDDVTSKDVRFIIEERIDAGNATRNAFVFTLGALYKWARRQEITEAHPTRDIERLATGSHEPWPEALLDEALKVDAIRLPVALMYYTGQRIGDVCKMRWDDVRDGFVQVVQQKTGKKLWIAIHRDLAAELTNVPKRGLTILTDDKGRPRKVDWLRRSLQAWATPRGHDVVPHGLRKNAVNALLEAECTLQEVAAITGQTFAIIEYYARRVNQRKLGKAAILKLEQKRVVQADGKAEG